VLIKRIQELQDEEDGSKISSGQILSKWRQNIKMSPKKKLKLTEYMWHNLFYTKGDQVEDARTNFYMCSEY